jgi:outer membrane protein
VKATIHILTVRASLIILGFMLANLSPGTARAEGQTPASNAPLKIGIVDVEAITRRSSSIQAKIRQAEQSVQADQDKIDVKLRDLQQMNQDLTSRRSVLSITEINAQEAKIRSLRDEVDDMQYQINKQLDRIRTEVMDPEVGRIMKTVSDVAKREGYDLIVRSEAVLYSIEKADLTPLVIQALDREDAQSAAKPATTPTATATPAAKPSATPRPTPGGRAPAKTPTPSGARNPSAGR